MNIDRLLGDLEILTYLEYLEKYQSKNVKTIQLENISYLDFAKFSPWSSYKLVIQNGENTVSIEELNLLLTMEMKEKIVSELIALRFTRMVMIDTPVFMRYSTGTKNLLILSKPAHDEFIVRHGLLPHKSFEWVMQHWNILKIEDKLFFVGLTVPSYNKSILKLFKLLDNL